MAPFHEDDDIFYFELSENGHLISPQSRFHLSGLSGYPSTESSTPNSPPTSKPASTHPFTHYPYEHLYELTQPDFYTFQKADYFHTQVQDTEPQHIDSPTTVSEPTDSSSESDDARSHDGHSDDKLHGLDEMHESVSMLNQINQLMESLLERVHAIGDQLDCFESRLGVALDNVRDSTEATKSEDEDAWWDQEHVVMDAVEGQSWN
ncbi:hypothetical protein ACJZ2D_004384 [Fusarium nematophilum]